MNKINKETQIRLIYSGLFRWIDKDNKRKQLLQESGVAKEWQETLLTAKIEDRWFYVREMFDCIKDEVKVSLNHGCLQIINSGILKN